MNASSSCRRALFYLFGSALVQFAAIAQGEDSPLPDNTEALLREIDAAWAKRQDNIRSVIMTIEMDEIVKGRGEQLAEVPSPFRIAVPKDDRLSKIIIEYAYKDGKIGFTRSSDGVTVAMDPEKTRPQTIQMTFDGETNASLIEETDLPMGSIQRTQVQSRETTVHVDLVALGLWINPKKVVEETGWLISRMSIEESSLDFDGIKCRRIRIPRDPPHGHRWTSAVDVSSERDWLPVRWQTWFNGKLTIKLTVKYKTDTEGLPVVEQWAYTRYNEGGESELIRRAQVKQFDVNGDVDESRFSIQFPIGTHVVEEMNSGNRYFIQQQDGLVPLSARDYGRKATADQIDATGVRGARVIAIGLPLE